MKIVLLTGEGDEHFYVANKLSSEVHLSAIVFDRGKKKTIIEKIIIFSKRYSIPQLFSRIVGKVISVMLRDDVKKRVELQRILGKENCLLQVGETPVVYLDGCNTPGSIDRMRQLQPDVLLVYGTGIVGNTILSIPSLVALNMHTGISPFYRGTGCAFWPLYYNEPHMIGATIHQCVAEVDGGMIYEVRKADLQPDDTLFSMFPRSVKVGAELYVEVVKKLLKNGKLEGRMQESNIGKEYKAAMKSWWKELVVRSRIHKGLISSYVISRGSSTVQTEPLGRILDD